MCRPYLKWLLSFKDTVESFRDLESLDSPILPIAVNTGVFPAVLNDELFDTVNIAL